jgi:hypothetical protein
MERNRLGTGNCQMAPALLRKTTAFGSKLLEIKEA